MQVVRDWRAVPAELRGGSLAIGNFDGVHRGHAAVLALLDAHPRGVMLFDPHPRAHFQPGRRHFTLTPISERLALLEAAGLAFAALLPFDAELAERSADAFVRDVLVAGFAARQIAVGYDFLFGKDRLGTPALLRAMGRVHGFQVSIADATGDSGEVFSSTRIRELLAEGDVAAAAEMLGRPWRVSGVVVGGAGRGTGLGFPTANIQLEPGVALGHGIYAVWVDTAGGRHRGAAYLGTRPTFDAGAAVLEIFLLDFAGDLYGQTIAVEFVGFVRPDAKFRSAEALAEQMASDCAAADAMLAASRRSPR